MSTTETAGQDPLTKLTGNAPPPPKTDVATTIQNQVAAALTKAQKAMGSLFPKHLTPEKMSRLALGMMRTNRTLNLVARENPDSFVSAVMTAGQLGLELGVFGEAFLVPFGKEVVMIPGYLGLMKLARNTGFITDIYAHEVRANDKFQMAYGLQRSLVHEPLSKGGFPVSDEERGPIVGFYAVAVYRDGLRTFWPVSLAEAIKTRDASRGYQAAKRNKKEHPWDTHFEAMGRKTAIRHLCNTLPKSSELSAALAIDQAHDLGKSAVMDGEFNVINEDWDKDDDPDQAKLAGPQEPTRTGAGESLHVQSLPTENAAQQETTKKEKSNAETPADAASGKPPGDLVDKADQQLGGGDPGPSAPRGRGRRAAPSFRDE